MKYEKNSDNKRKKITNEDYFIQLEIFGKSWKGRAKDFLVKMRGEGSIPYRGRLSIRKPLFVNDVWLL